MESDKFSNLWHNQFLPHIIICFNGNGVSIECKMIRGFSLCFLKDDVISTKLWIKRQWWYALKSWENYLHNLGKFEVHQNFSEIYWVSSLYSWLLMRIIITTREYIRTNTQILSNRLEVTSSFQVWRNICHCVFIKSRWEVIVLVLSTFSAWENFS